MISRVPPKTDRKQSLINITLAVLAGQVGCLTLLIVLLAVFGGLWLDNNFHTRPIITLVLVIASVPVSVLIMLKVVRSALAKLKPESGAPDPSHPEEVSPGKNN